MQKRFYRFGMEIAEEKSRLIAFGKQGKEGREAKGRNQIPSIF